MVEKGKVRTAIDAKFKGKSLSKNFKDSLAAKWAAKIEKDEDIEEFVNEREDIILEASAEADRIRTLAKIEAEKDIQDKIKGQKGADPEPEPTDDPEMPKWAKAMMQKLEKSEQELATLKLEKQTETLEQRFRNDPALKGIPDFLLKRAIPKSEDQFESSKEELTKEWSEFATANKLAAFGSDAPSGSAEGKKVGSEQQASEADVDAVMAQL